jgi:SAM-dependent methyltransferase
MTVPLKRPKPGYQDSINCLEQMKQDARRQFAKDSLFIRSLRSYFSPGPILEIGAGVGQLSLILQTLGFTVLASDIQPWMVEYMRTLGLNAQQIDCLNIYEATGQTFPNILAQGPSPFVTNSLHIVASAYQSVFDALADKGRFIFIFPDSADRSRYSRLADHWPIIAKTGFRLIRHFRHQVLPSHFYRYVNTAIHALLENSLGRLIGIRNILILEKPAS